MNEEIRLLIVDDEQLIRELLKKIICWNELGVCLIGEAESAGQALELSESLHPDLVITDICMSRMDGISLADILIKRYPSVKVVILTGYEEFEYAKRSVRAGVSEYLVKPINAREIRKTVFRLREEILKERCRQEEISALRRDLTEEAASVEIEAPPEDTHLIERVKKYIKNHLSDPNLSLSTAAKEFHLSAGYVSRTFKQETGMNFTRFLLRARMEQAATLLKTTEMPGYQIGEAVGIPDSHYFSICFKKYTGFSINDFRKENRYKK